MAGLNYRPAQRSSAKPLIGFYAESGGGKTKSALLLARGFVGPEGNITMIETEAGRGEAFVDEIPGGYNVIPLTDDFNPRRYGEAIHLAEKQKADALIIDSASHEWEGVGGVLSMASARQEKGIKGVLVWQEPKISHLRHFMLPLLQTPIPLVIVCMRAKYPMVEFKNSKGEKEWVRSGVLEPKQSDDILFELFCHGWFDREQHRFHATRYTTDDIREGLRDNEIITIETGQRLATIARRKKTAAPPKPVERSTAPEPEKRETPPATSPTAPSGDGNQTAEDSPPPAEPSPMKQAQAAGVHEDVQVVYNDLYQELRATRDPRKWWKDNTRSLQMLEEQAPMLHADLVKLGTSKQKRETVR